MRAADLARFSTSRTRSDGPATTFGERSIFARIDQSEIAARLRANYALGPDVTLEAYVEPFASAGDYSGFGELIAPRTHELLHYGSHRTNLERDENGDYRVTDGPVTFTFEDPAFHVRSLRSNLVLRWEWRPGSTLFIVWQQDRAADGLPGARVEPADLWRAKPRLCG